MQKIKSLLPVSHVHLLSYARANGSARMAAWVVVAVLKRQQQRLGVVKRRWSWHLMLNRMLLSCEEGRWRRGRVRVWMECSWGCHRGVRGLSARVNECGSTEWSVQQIVTWVRLRGFQNTKLPLTILVRLLTSEKRLKRSILRNDYLKKIAINNHAIFVK